MKKIITILMIVPLFLAIPLIFGNLPEAKAASIDTGQLLEFMSSEETTATIKEIVKIGTEIKKGNTDTLKNAVFKSALERAGIPGQVSEVIINDIKNIKASPETISQEIAKRVETALKDQLKARLNERLSPYQKEILLLSTLLN